MSRRPLSLAACLLAGTGLVLLGGQAYLRAKAALAGVLIDRALEASLSDGRAHPPWPWADMRPLARLDVPRNGLRRTVLSGATGQSLAFGLAHVSGTALPGEPGNCVIAGHRDTWAAFMRSLDVGDEVRLQTRAGLWRYRVQSVTVLERERVDALDPGGEDRLTLITCYPFSGLLRSPWRLVIVCGRL